MRLGRDQLRPVCSPLIGFGGMKVQPVGTITLPVVVGSYPQQITKEMNFLVVDCSSSYNAIIGRLTLNSWKTVTSTYHLSVKFPMEYGLGQAQGNQLAVRECYLAMKEKTKQDLVQFLRKSIDVFAWSHEDMPRIDPSVITH